MNNEVKYVLPTRWLYQLADRIVEHGEQRVQQGILTGIIQNLNPSLYRDVFRSIIKATYKSGDETAAGRLSVAIVKGSDHITAQKRHEADMRELCG